MVRNLASRTGDALTGGSSVVTSSSIPPDLRASKPGRTPDLRATGRHDKGAAVAVEAVGERAVVLAAVGQR
jgi:hypothetical protein